MTDSTRWSCLTPMERELMEATIGLRNADNEVVETFARLDATTWRVGTREYYSLSMEWRDAQARQRRAEQAILLAARLT